MNKIYGNHQTIAARNLRVGDHFIYNYAGGNRTIYRCTKAPAATGNAVIEFVTGSGQSGRFHTSGLSTLVLL